jgi:hypothetical protein
VLPLLLLPSLTWQPASRRRPRASSSICPNTPRRNAAYWVSYAPPATMPICRARRRNARSCRLEVPARVLAVEEDGHTPSCASAACSSGNGSNTSPAAPVVRGRGAGAGFGTVAAVATTEVGCGGTPAPLAGAPVNAMLPLRARLLGRTSGAFGSLATAWFAWLRKNKPFGVRVGR